MAHFALQKLHILPSTLANMSEREKALVYASIQLRIEEEKRQNDKIKKLNATRGVRRGRGQR